MVKKIITNLNSLNPMSNKIVLYGSVIALMLCVTGVGIIAYNNIIANQINLYKIGTSMIYNSIVLFAQMVIGGIVIDFFSNMMNNNDD